MSNRLLQIDEHMIDLCKIAYIRFYKNNEDESRAAIKFVGVESCLYVESSDVEHVRQIWMNHLIDGGGLLPLR